MGKTWQSVQCSDLSLETPPRAWGRLIERRLTLRRVGNTPTCMGKTNYMDLSIRSFKKHPHVHGEDFIKSVDKASNLETPPRAWGRHWNLQGSQVALVVSLGLNGAVYFSTTSCNPDNSIKSLRVSPSP